MSPASGTQHTLRAGDYEAVIASVGASLRCIRLAGRELVLPFDADEVRPGYRGVTLAPWPNRIVDGVYDFDGVRHQAPLTEPQRGHALHGLVAWLDFDAIDKSASHVTLAATIVPQPAYPWRVRIETTYALGHDGLTQTVRAVNESDEDVPFGTGPHPYLVAGPASLDEWTLSLPADQVLTVTPDRLAPVGLEGVGDEADRFDFRDPRVIGEVALDHAFTGLSYTEGLATVTLTDPSGVGVGFTWGAECGWVQVYTGDLPSGRTEDGHRAGVAVEPMTCGPDAFNDARYPFDTGLLRLSPGCESVASWRLFGF